MTYLDVLGRIPGARRTGKHYIGRCPAHVGRQRDLWIRAFPGKTHLLCFAGCDIHSICIAIGIAVRDLYDERTTAGTDDQSLEDRFAYARKLWDSTQSAKETAVEQYLKHRGITLEIPRSVRYVTISCDEYPQPMRFPAMAAGIQDPAGRFSGVLVTALCADGSAKAPTENPRKIHGVLRGGAVRLSNALTISKLAVGEGIETMLSVMQAAAIPCWAALTANNLAVVQLHESVREVIVCADNDEAGLRAADRAARRFIHEGRDARIAKPVGAKDFNEVLNVD